MAAPYRALLVGIDQYESPTVGDLSGCVADAEAMAELLMSAYSLAPTQIRLLASPPSALLAAPSTTTGSSNVAIQTGNQQEETATVQQPSSPSSPLNTSVQEEAAIEDWREVDSSTPSAPEVSLDNLEASVEPATTTPEQSRFYATRAAILEGIRDFLGETPPGEEALFFFSGNGSVANLDPAIQFGDRQGETLVPADGRSSNTLDILDRELRLLFSELIQRGIRLTLMMDTCHTGDVFRSDKRAVPQNLPTLKLAAPGRTTRDLGSLLGGTVSADRLEALYMADPLAHTVITACLPKQSSYEIPVEGGKRGVFTLALVRVLETLAFVRVPEQAEAGLTYRELGRALQANMPEARGIRQSPNVSGTQERLLFSSEELGQPRTLFGIEAVTSNGIEFNGGETDGVFEGSELTSFADWTLAKTEGRWRVTKSWAQRSRAVLVEGEIPMMAGQPLRLDTVPNRPTIFFAPSAETVAQAWRKRDLLGSPYLVESFRADVDYVVQAEGEDWVVRRRDGSELEALRSPRDRRSLYRLAAEVDRVACYESFRDMVPPPTERLPFDPYEVVEVLLEQVDWQGQGTVIALGEGTSLPARTRVRITVTNNQTTPLFVVVYRMDPKNTVAERVWPTEGTEQLDPGQARATIWPVGEPSEALQLKVFVSTYPLGLPQWPCGRNEVTRGASFTFPIAQFPATALSQWAVWTMTKREPATLFNGGNAYAVLIGINKYDSPNIKDLQGCVADANAFHAWLTNQAGGGYLKQNVRLLAEGRTKRDEIVNALHEMAQRCNEESILVIMFSGHGHRIGDDEVVLITSDSTHSPGTSIEQTTTQEDAQTGITGRLLSEILATCPAHYITILWDSNFGMRLPIRRGLSVLAAAQEDEVAVETSIGETRRGAFSHWVLNALQEDVVTDDGIVHLIDLFESLKPTGPSADRQHHALNIYPGDNPSIALFQGGIANPPQVDSEGFRYDIYLSFSNSLSQIEKVKATR